MARKLADRRLWFTADKSELVEDGDPDAAFLAATPGRPLPDAPIRKQAAPAEDKALDVAEDKAVTKTDDKTPTPRDTGQSEKKPRKRAAAVKKRG